MDRGGSGKMGYMRRSFEELGLRRMTPIQQLRAGRLLPRLLWLYLGLGLFGVSLALLIQASLGMAPWDVLHYGLAQHVPLSIGTILIIVSGIILLLWIPLREMPGLGTVSNAVVVGLVLDAVLPLLPPMETLPAQIPAMLGAILLNGLGTAMYIGAQFGPGPRDGLMTGLARLLPISVRVIRTGIEVTVVLVGWLLGGIVGVATVIFALSIGPMIQAFLPWTVIRLDDPEPPAAAVGATIDPDPNAPAV